MWWILAITLLVVLGLPIGVYLDGKLIKKRLKAIDASSSMFHEKIKALSNVIYGRGFKQADYEGYNGLIKDVSSFDGELLQTKHWVRSTHTQVIDWIKIQHRSSSDLRRQIGKLSSRLDEIEQNIQNLRKEQFNLHVALYAHLNELELQQQVQKRQIEP